MDPTTSIEGEPQLNFSTEIEIRAAAHSFISLGRALANNAYINEEISADRDEYVMVVDELAKQCELESMHFNQTEKPFGITGKKKLDLLHHGAKILLKEQLELQDDAQARIDKYKFPGYNEVGMDLLDGASEPLHPNGAGYMPAVKMLAQLKPLDSSQNIGHQTV